MANLNLTKNVKLGHEVVEDVLFFEMNSSGNVTSATVENFNGSRIVFNTNTWDGESLENLTSQVACYLGGEITWEQLKNYDMSMSESEAIDGHIRQYVKDSYIFGKYNIKQMFNIVAKKYGYTTEFLKKYSSIDIQKSNTVLINGVYVTPSMLGVVCKEYLKITESLEDSRDLNKRVENFVNDYIKSL